MTSILSEIKNKEPIYTITHNNISRSDVYDGNIKITYMEGKIVSLIKEDLDHYHMIECNKLYKERKVKRKKII